jgi:hypothetical protein
MKRLCKGYGMGHAFRILFSLFAYFLFYASGSIAQTPASRSEWTNFSSAFSHLAAREKVTILMEDSPFRDRLTPEKLEKLLTDHKSDDALKRCQAVADAFDYECTREGNILILRKRYSDIKDLPFVSYEEARIALDNIERSLAPWNPPGPTLYHPHSAFFQFLHSLTPEQLELLKYKTLPNPFPNQPPPLQPVTRPMTIFTPEQRQLLRTVCIKEYMQTYATLERINTWYLKQLTKPDTVFRWVETVPETPTILVLDGPLGLNGRRVQKGISHGFEFQSGGPSDLWNPQYTTPGNRPGFGTSAFIWNWDAAQTKMFKDALTDLIDRTVPTPEVQPAPAPAQRLTLAQAVERLTARAGDGESYEVDPALATKPVCLFALENAPTRAIFDSLAALYALDIAQPQEKVFRLIPPRPPRVRGYNDVLTVLRRCFPEPYQRYYHAQFEARMAFLKKPENQSDFATRISGDAAAAHVLRSHYANRAAPYLRHAIYDIAVQRLRAEVEPRLAKSAEGVLKFSEAGGEAQRFLTMLCLIETFVRLDPTSAPLTTVPGVADGSFGTWFEQFDSLMIQADVTVNSEGSGGIVTILNARGERVFDIGLGGGPPRGAAFPR